LGYLLRNANNAELDTVTCKQDEASCLLHRYDAEGPTIELRNLCDTLGVHDNRCTGSGLGSHASSRFRPVICSTGTFVHKFLRIQTFRELLGLRRFGWAPRHQLDQV